ncbi:MAG: hypothetical protein FWG05_05810, partial [Kiritimatiellaeota bacterium]|nr:hypothetical protein [Kiritimatiellota bacterium]
MALAFWLQAVSELYQAVFLLFVMPFFVCAMMPGRWRLLKDWRGFWAPLAVAAIIGGALSLWFLWPYFTTLQSNTLSRGLDEIRTHVLEPFSYLRSFNRRWDILGVIARKDEMYVYPTLAVLMLAVCSVVAVQRRRRTAPPLHILLFTSLALFVIIATGIYHAPETFKRLGGIYRLLPLVSTALLVPMLLWNYNDSGQVGRPVPHSFIRGLFAAAVFAFFMSLGPEIVSQKTGVRVENKLFMLLYNHIGALRGFRVVSRFSIFVMMALIVAACYGLEYLTNKLHRETRRITELHREKKHVISVKLCAFSVFLCVIFFTFVYETIPKPIKTIPLEVPLKSAVLDSLDARKEPFVLAMLPMANRNIDSQMMLQAARHNRLSVWAWGGAYPPFTDLVGGTMKYGNDHPAKTGADLLRQLWPEALLLEDKHFSPDRVHA